MQNSKLILVIIGILVLGGGFLAFRYFSKPSQSPPAGQPTNPPGVVNEEVESANYKLYSNEEFKRAREGGKIVMLYFTANWCPICREQEPLNMEALKALEDEAFGFRIHILDSETTKENEELAERYSVRIQHTTIILNSKGEAVSTYTGPLTTGDLKKRLEDAKTR